MAKPQNGLNKSAAIRDLLETNPNLSTKEVVDTLAAINVRAEDVYNVRAILKKKGGPKPKRRRRSAGKAATNGAAHGTPASIDRSLEVLRQVKALAVELGGMRTLKQLVDVMAQ